MVERADLLRGDHERGATGALRLRDDGPRPGQERPRNPRSRDLPRDLRASMQSRFQQDFARVRVHSDARAAEMAAALRARAVTRGNEIFFGAGNFDPRSARGRSLIAHELTHVAQAAEGVARPGDPASPNEVLEREARAAAAAFATGARIPVVRAIARAQNGALRNGDDKPPGPTLGNAPVDERGRTALPDKPYPGAAQRRIELVKDTDGLWKERGPRGFGGRARGSYDFVIQDGRVRAVKPGARNYGHTEAALGGRVTYAGRIEFGRPGELARWSNESGHYRGSRYFAKEVAEAAGLPFEKFDAHVRAPGDPLPQLPVQQPGDNPPAGGGRPDVAAKPGAGVGATESKLPEPGVATPGAATKTPAPGAKPGGAGDHAPVVKPGATEPQVAGGRPAGRAGGGRLAGGVKFAAPIVLEMVTAYYINKHEQQVIAQAIKNKIATADVKNRIVEEVEKDRLNIAYKQMRGGTVYATVDLRMHLLNEIMNSDVELERVRLTDKDESSSMSTVMSHDAIVGSEHKTRWDTVSMPVPKLEVSESERLQLNLRALDETSAAHGHAPPPAEREKLLADIARAEKAEAAEREAEIARPRVLADPKLRAKQQAELMERLRKRSDKSEAAPSAASGSDTSGLLPAPGTTAGAAVPSPGQTATPRQGTASFFPGAPGENTTAEAARLVTYLRGMTVRIYDSGMGLEARLASANSPSEVERKGWVANEVGLRDKIKYFMNILHEKSRDEAVRDLAQLLDEYGPKLAQIHTHLVG